MVKEELKQYISEQRESGTPYEQVRGWLVANGWGGQDVDDTYSALYPGRLPGQLGEFVQKQRILSFSILIVFLLSVVVIWLQS